ncbi:hypothetical protein GCM10010112_80610 [Actinoplanes lobatus]|uniref:Uncharacterized protein n=1 Tax=Actinoplanes lobatus TaxID=113568 RepID=A0A7W7MKY8_9ACTN|nr:hypothetical protein [Actinoplanes lobatus]MBB4753978.1 hypothetical protein [Actinoplanes lobatus]GGN92941.1 hypothetical protein GCM10010112_80610 [Actinoplanes lobatus]GIE44026.1 hypothetical protein Alo02nite_69240 [Actinoplanes lobatus]
MGYSGVIVVARFEQPVAGSSLSGEMPVLDELVFDDGWRCMWVDRDSPLKPQEVVAVTRAPALCAYIFDSDVADVEATSPGGNHWHVYLHPETAEELGAPALEQPLPEAIAHIVGWAREAGSSVDSTVVAQALTAKNVFVEDTLLNLVKILGVASG